MLCEEQITNWDSSEIFKITVNHTGTSMLLANKDLSITYLIEDARAVAIMDEYDLDPNEVVYVMCRIDENSRIVLGLEQEKQSW